MSGFEALGMVCSIIQVISFSHEVFSLCKTVYDGRLTVNNHLEAAAESMVTASRGVDDYFESIAPRTTDEESLLDMAKTCRATAEKLDAELKLITYSPACGKSFCDAALHVARALH